MITGLGLTRAPAGQRISGRLVKRERGGAEGMESGTDGRPGLV